ncbi:hypothetical protein [Alkalimarinus coralli]|uniref:hypothetical protein n=1 Tax=Alkalimarinus coralli TaxID=2935863 RepID=UPI00202B8CC2|nr:hypothetical protein [Alkalimarinus coralli]
MNSWLSGFLVAAALGVSTTVVADSDKPGQVPSAGSGTSVDRAAYTEEQVTRQLNFLMANTYKSAQENIKSEGGTKPYAAGLLPNGDVKPLKLNKEQPVPVDIAVRVLGSAMTSWMDKGLAVASVVYYTQSNDPSSQSAGADSKGDKNRLLKINLKHANGKVIVRTVPYLVKEDGTVGFGEVIEASPNQDKQ